MATENLNLEAIELTDNMQTSLLQKMNGNFTKIDTAYGQLKDLLLAKTGKDNLKDAIEYVDQLVNAHDATITADKVLNGYVGYSGQGRIEGTALSKATSGVSTDLMQGKTLYNDNGELVTGNMPTTTAGTYIPTSDYVVTAGTYRLGVLTSGYYEKGAYLGRPTSTVLNDMGVTAIPTINVTLTGDYSSYVSSYGAGINKSGVLVIWAKSSTSSYEHISFNASSIGAGSTSLGWGVTSYDTSDPIAAVYACTVNGLSGYTTINITLNASDIDSSNDYVQVDVTLTAS